MARGVGHVAPGFSRGTACVSEQSSIKLNMERCRCSLELTPLQTARRLPPMMSLGRAHRLYLLNRLDRLERQDVSQEDHGGSGGLHHHGAIPGLLGGRRCRAGRHGLQQVPQLQLRRLLALRPLSPEAREPWGALNAGDTTATEAAGAPPQDAAKEELQHGTTSTYTGASFQRTAYYHHCRAARSSCWTQRSSARPPLRSYYKP